MRFTASDVFRAFGPVQKELDLWQVMSFGSVQKGFRPIQSICTPYQQTIKYKSSYLISKHQV
jgi:hypothetical protein